MSVIEINCQTGGTIEREPTDYETLVAQATSDFANQQAQEQASSIAAKQQAVATLQSTLDPAVFAAVMALADNLNA